jgi:hypothetical protein
MCSYEMGCLGFFESKDIAEDKQIHKILAGLQDTVVDKQSLHVSTTILMEGVGGDPGLWFQT